MEYGAQLEKLNKWVGQKLTGCPVRDGVTFHNNNEKIFKILRRRRGWYIEFSVPVPACQGLTELTPEEARTKKLGRTRWIYRGTSDENVQKLVAAAIASLPQPYRVVPAMTREIRVVSEYTCPCHSKWERIIKDASIPQEIVSPLKEAWRLLKRKSYNEFIRQIGEVYQISISRKLNEKGIDASGNVYEQIERAINHKILPQFLKVEAEELSANMVFERHFENQERAYPVALMLVSFTSKIIKFLK